MTPVLWNQGKTPGVIVLTRYMDTYLGKYVPRYVIGLLGNRIIPCTASIVQFMNTY